MKACMVYNARDSMIEVNKFITPDDSAVMNVATELKKQCISDDFRYIVKTAFDYVALNVKYITDKQHFGKDEWWQYPREVLTEMIGDSPFSHIMWGDCEDSSFLLASLLLAMGMPDDRVRVGISSSHAWVEAKLDKWYILESTDDKPLTYLKTRRDIAGKRAYKPVIYVYHQRCKYE